MKRKVLLVLLVVAVVAFAALVVPEVVNAGWAWSPDCPNWHC